MAGKWVKTFDELPGEVFEESPGTGPSYSIHKGLIYANWKVPQLYSDDVLKALVETYELGFDGSMAGWSLRLSPTTIENWLIRGKLLSDLKAQGLMPHPKFEEVATVYLGIYEKCMAGKAAGISRRLGRIESAPDWRAQAWLLEKLVPHFSPRQTVTLNIDFDKLSDDELEKLARTGKL